MRVSLTATPNCFSGVALATRLPSLFNDELLDLCYQFIRIIRMNGQLDGGEKIQAEDTHDGLSVHDIAARGKVNLAVKGGNRVYKVADVGDRGQFDVCCFHS